MLLEDKGELMKEYNSEWFMEILLSLRMAKKVFPNYMIGDDDPEDIKELKNKFYKIGCEIEDLESDVYHIIKEKKEN